MQDEEYMQLAISEALKGQGFTNPNPIVGAVIVKEGRIIGTGFHRRCGTPHAERNALASCSESPTGATIYTTLIPCCHHGKTPPCTDALIEAGIARVVVGSQDPNPLVADKSARLLRNAGIELTEGVLTAQCDAINQIFFHFITTKTPYVLMKYAMTADGKIATRTGASRWVTGPSAREYVHQLRHRFAAILVGVGTILADDPLLSCRMENGCDPLRIICDSRLRTPLDSQVVQTAHDIPTLIVTSCTDYGRQQRYRDCNIEVLELPGADGRVDLKALMSILGERHIDSILLEGGATLNYAALESGIVNKLAAFVAPQIFGGTQAISPVGGTGVGLPLEAFKLQKPVISMFADDILIEWEVE